MKALLVCLSAAICLTVSAGVHAQSPDPIQPFVHTVTFGGSGCPQGAVASSFSNDRRMFTLIFDRYVANSGPGVPATDARKNCQIRINVSHADVTGPFCVALSSRGFVQLPADVTAESGAVHHFPSPDPTGQDPQEIRNIVGEGAESFTGPIAKDYLREDSLDLLWSAGYPESPLAVRAATELRLEGLLDQRAQITLDSIDGTLKPGRCVEEDTTPPTITISNPVPFGLYGLGASVTPVFTCADEDSGVASCTASAVLDTTSIGPKTFTVTAIDNAGNSSTASVSFAVGGKNECKTSGHAKFLAPAFKNQGQCVSSFVK
jgi:hypothetical protein